jgi:hypothetical protein
MQAGSNNARGTLQRRFENIVADAFTATAWVLRVQIDDLPHFCRFNARSDRSMSRHDLANGIQAVLVQRFSH